MAGALARIGVGRAEVEERHFGQGIVLINFKIGTIINLAHSAEVE